MVRRSQIANELKVLSAFALILLPKATQAFEAGISIPGHTGNTYDSYTDYIIAIFTFALRAGAILTVLMITYAGFKYMTSQGNQSAVNEAKDIIIGSLSGFAMLLLIYLILNILGMPTF